MKGTTKPKIHVVIKDVTKVTDYKGKKYKYTLVTNPLVLITVPLCIENGDIEWAMIKLFSKAHTGNLARSIRDKYNSSKEYNTNQLEELTKKLHELNKKIYMDNPWSKNNYQDEKVLLEKFISYCQDALNRSFGVKEFDFRLDVIKSFGWTTIKEKSQNIMGLYGNDNLEVAYKQQYKNKKSPLLTYKHRNKPYGVTNRFERNMLEFIDIVSNDLPSYKKTKRIKVKAVKHNLRFQTTRQMERDILQDYDDTRLLMWEEACRDMDDYKYSPWSDQYGMDDYYWWLEYHYIDHYAHPVPSEGYYDDRIKGRLAYKPGAFEDARYDEAYDYRDDYDYDYASKWEDDLYAEIVHEFGLNDKL